jgi:hypothetical protein
MSVEERGIELLFICYPPLFCVDCRRCLTIGPANLWHPERLPWLAAFTAVQCFCLFRPTSVSTLWRVCVYIHIHISDCVETAYELLLLPRRTASETFWHQLVTVRSVDWIFITGAPAWRWPGEYETFEKGFYSLLFKDEAVTVPDTCIFSSLSHSSSRPLLEIS